MRGPHSDLPESKFFSPSYGGVVPFAAGLDAAGVFLSSSFLSRPLSPRKASAILPKKPFFFLASCWFWTPAACSGFPFVAEPFVGPLVVGGGSAFSEVPPKIREKKPCTPLG